MSFSFTEHTLSDGDISYRIRRTYREPGKKYPVHSGHGTFRRSELIREGHEDPRAFVEQRCRELEAEEKLSLGRQHYMIDFSRRIGGVADDGPGEAGTSARKSIGYLPYLALYHALGIDSYVDGRRKRTGRDFNHNTILQHLVYARCLFPGSKLDFWRHVRPRFFGKTDYALHDVYRCLEDVVQWRDPLLRAVDKGVSSFRGRDGLLIYYDVTNYYFEIDEDDDDGLRAKGVSKEHRKTPIVQMGLMMDTNGIPISYELFRGNTSDTLTLEGAMASSPVDLRGSTRIIVADKGMMSADNLARIRLDRNGYVISRSVRGADKETKDWVLGKEGWKVLDSYTDGDGNTVIRKMVKERYVPRKVRVSERDSRTLERLETRSEAEYDERQVCLYSLDYALRAGRLREETLKDASDLVGRMSSSADLSRYGKLKFVRSVPKNKEDGQYVDAQVDRYQAELDFDAIDEDARFDGFYIISTNVEGKERVGNMRFPRCGFVFRDGFLVLNRDVPAEEIASIYGGLWQIEETFKVTKTDMMHFRPVYHHRDDMIRAHFLVCFIALVLERVLEHMLGPGQSAATIQRALSELDGALLPGSNVYLFSDVSPTAIEIGKLFDIDYNWSFRKMGDITALIARLKKYKR